MPLIEIDGIRVAYEDAGAGLPIIFIPGLVGTKDWFVNQSTGLHDRYRIISCDLRADATHSGYNLDVLTNDLSRFISALKLDSAVIAGYCFGAMIAQRFAVLHREQADALILLSAFPNLQGATRESIIELMAPGKVHVEAPFRAAVKRLLHMRPARPKEGVEGTEWLEAHSANLTKPALDARIHMVEQFDALDWLPEIEEPTLVITGAGDREPFLHGAQTLYEKIPNAQLEVIEDADHFCFFSRHDVVNALIDEFLTERLMSL